jgi:hypothetical protein
MKLPSGNQPIFCNAKVRIVTWRTAGSAIKYVRLLAQRGGPAMSALTPPLRAKATSTSL